MQVATHVLMIRPVHFGFNPQTGADNAFLQALPHATKGWIREQAIREFDQVVATLKALGIGVTVFEDRLDPVCPDAVFANNWISFHENGEIILYPMFAPSRRLERRRDIVSYFLSRNPAAKLTNLAEYETLGVYLEGTGSIVRDPINRVAYACESLRTHPGFFERYCEYIGWEPVLFQASDVEGKPIYHTHVMLSIGEQFAVLCEEVIAQDQGKALVERLEGSGRTLITCTEAQMKAFCCNLLEVKNESGKSFILMSDTASQAFTDRQRAQLQVFGQQVVCAIPTIEKVGGGGVRCLLTEIFGSYDLKLLA